MRRIILFIAGVACACVVMLTGATSAQALSLGFKSSGSASSPSAEVWLMDLGTVLQIGTFDITVAYDPLLLAFNSATFGSYLGDPLLVDSYGNPLVLTDAKSESSGTAYAYEVSFLDPLPAQPDAFVLFTMNFDAIGTGTSLLKFDSVILGDANGDEINTIELINGSVDVNPVPEPNTLLLLCAGLGSLLVWRGRFRS